jgi:transposase
MYLVSRLRDKISDLEVEKDNLLSINAALEAKLVKTDGILALTTEEIAALKAKIAWFEEQFHLYQHRMFGASSERTSPEQMALLFNEAEATAAEPVAEPTIEEITYKRRKTQGQREEQLKDLKVETVEHHLPAEEQFCAVCTHPLHTMGHEVRQELKYIPAQMILVKHVRDKYSCRYCEENEISTQITVAPMPRPAFPNSIASPSVVAFIINQKYCLHIPLYRIEKSLEYDGCLNINRQTMANWVITAAIKHLCPLFDRMHELLVQRDILHADETTMQVLHEQGRKAQEKSYLWLYRSGRGERPIVLYDYQTTRAGQHPNRFLEGFTGFLHVDGYKEYDKMPGVKRVSSWITEPPSTLLAVREKRQGVILIACWSHARRYFKEALIPFTEKQLAAAQTPPVALAGLKFCNDLFKIERGLRACTPQARKAARLLQSIPVLESFKKWLDCQVIAVAPAGKTGKAIGYCLNQWSKLTAFLLDGRLELDNNRGERSIKPTVIGRKNYYFANVPKGARASAILYSLVETAKENDLVPFKYLENILERMPNIDQADTAEIDKLLPWSPWLPEDIRLKPKNTTEAAMTEA